MKLAQRIVLLAGAIGVFDSSLVPPVQQVGGDLCRYHEFMGRSWPFTRTYGATGVDGVALLSEAGVILSLTAIAYLALGWFANRSRVDA